jgi:hypothetical protein
MEKDEIGGQKGKDERAKKNPAHMQVGKVHGLIW